MSNIKRLRKFIVMSLNCSVCEKEIIKEHNSSFPPPLLPPPKKKSFNLVIPLKLITIIRNISNFSGCAFCYKSMFEKRMIQSVEQQKAAILQSLKQ